MKKHSFITLLFISGTLSLIAAGTFLYKTSNSEDSNRAQTTAPVANQPLKTTDTTILSEPSAESIQLFDSYSLHKAVSFENLQLFYITGKEQIKGNKYLALSEAMEKKVVTVNETGSVNQLSIDNNSDEFVFIHSGDIVKGGKQDRTIGYDMIIPPNSKNVPLGSFCVESGRWQQRSGEELSNFGSNTMMLSSRKLKLAAKYEGNQGKVWANVSDQQNKLNTSVSKTNGYDVVVNDVRSESSLQLALENKDLGKAKKAMQEVFVQSANQYPDAIGYAYAINGTFYGADIYNNRALFNDVWGKLLESIIVEAISEKDTIPTIPIALESMAKTIVTLEQNQDKTQLTISNKNLNKATRFETTEDKEQNLLFSTHDETEHNWVHKNYMKKDSTQAQQGQGNAYEPNGNLLYEPSTRLNYQQENTIPVQNKK